MSDLHFTFSSKQLQAQIAPQIYAQHQINPAIMQPSRIKQMSIRALRSRRLQRYEKYMQSIEIDSPTNQNGQSKSAASIIGPIQRARTIQEKQANNIVAARPRVFIKSKHFPLGFQQAIARKPQSMQLIRESTKNDQPIKEQLKSVQLQSNQAKKQYNAFKDSPKIRFPSNDKRLPKAFRFRSMSQQQTSSLPSQHTPRFYKPSAASTILKEKIQQRMVLKPRRIKASSTFLNDSQNSRAEVLLKWASRQIKTPEKPFHKVIHDFSK